MNKKTLLIKIPVISIIFLFMDMNFSSPGLTYTEPTVINKQITKDYVDKTSIGKTELKILYSYQIWRGEDDFRIFFIIKNVGSETFDGYITSHGEVSPFSNPSDIWAELGHWGHFTLNPGQESTFGYIGLYLPIPFGLYYVRYQIYASGDDDSLYGNKMTEIILMWDFIYFPIFRFYR
jgi:hypothetical protein